MNKLLFLFFVIAFGADTYASQKVESYYWLCGQPGTMKREPTLILSTLFTSSETNKEEKERVFLDIIEEYSSGKFSGYFDATCNYYTSQESALSHLKKRIKYAKENKFKINFVNFPQ